MVYIALPNIFRSLITDGSGVPIAAMFAFIYGLMAFAFLTHRSNSAFGIASRVEYALTLVRAVVIFRHILIGLWSHGSC